jgi:hypothetical protein
LAQGGSITLRSRFVIAFFAIVCALLPAAAVASESRSLEQVSVGGAGGPASNYKGSSADGTRVFFQTADSLVASDTDTSMDVYERAGGVTTLISTGPAGGNGAFGATFSGASDDGSKVVFRTAEAMVSGDTDANQDLYLRSGGTTTQVSTGPTGGNGETGAIFDGMSSNGSRIWFETLEPLVSSDTDSQFDIYERNGSTTSLISTGPAGGNGEYDASFEGSSKDGTRVFFSTDESLVTADTDPSLDVYQRSGSTTTILSIGPAGGNGDDQFDYDAFFEGASDDGTKVWIDTTETLTADDLDNSNDLYQMSGGTMTRISLGPAGGDAEIPAFFDGASADGSRVFFDTREALDPADTDSSVDIYQRSGGTTTLLSIGPDGGNGALNATFKGASTDGGVVFFHTAESLVLEDSDTQQDVYKRTGGQTTLLSAGPDGGNGPMPASFNAASSDGLRVYFTTSEALEAADTDGLPDLYQRYAGDTTRISTGPSGGNGAFFVTFDDISADGTRAFFDTAEALAPTDTDAANDVYGSTYSIGYPRPKGATPFRTSLVPAYQACSSPGNRMHGAPLAYESCNPPTMISGFLTMGSPDANGKAANAQGQAKYVTINGNAATPADEADLIVGLTLSDVRKKSDLTDYTGQLQFVTTWRITDRRNGSAPVDPGTVQDVDFAATATCAATADANVGSSCTLNTTADAIMPGAIVEQQRTMIQLTQAKIFDGGADGLVSTAPNTLFAVQGIFIP